jgi:hypothetical protein
MRIRQYKNCCTPQVCCVSTNTRRLNEKNARIVHTGAYQRERPTAWRNTNKAVGEMRPPVFGFY